MKRRMLKKKLNIALVVFTFVILTLSFTALAADQEFKVTTNVTDGYTYSDGLLTFVKGGEYTIEMAEGVELTTHRIKIHTQKISSDTGKITLIFSKLNMISYSENNIESYAANKIDMNIVIDGNNTITNMNDNNNNVKIHCLTLGGSTNVTITGNGKLTLKAKDPNSQMAAKTFTLNSKDVILDFNYHCLIADGIYINSGEMNIISGADQCLLSNGEFLMTGGTLKVTSINGGPCIQVRDVGPRDGVGIEIRGNSNVTLRNTGSKQCIAPIYLLCRSYPKSIMINTTGTVRLENKGNGVAGIFFYGNKAKDFTISGGTLVIDGYMRGIWRYNGSSGNLNFNGGEIEIIGTTANAIYGRGSGETGGSQGAYWGESYKHKNYAGTAAETRSEISDSSVLNNSSSKYKYLLITPTYDITYNLHGGTVSPPNANPTLYTRVDGITLTNPTQNLKEFVGWTGSNGTIPQKNVTISVGSTGNLEYKANWDNLPYTVYFFSNYEPGTYNTQTLKYNESEKLDANSFTRAGYNFTGWNTEGQPTTEKPGVHYDDQAELNISISNRLTEDRLSLWAQWNPIPAQPPTIITQPQNVDLIVGYSGGG